MVTAKIKNSKKGNLSIIDFSFTCIAVVLIFCAFLVAALFVNDVAEEKCISILADSASQLAERIKFDIEKNSESLENLAVVLEHTDDFSKDNVIEIVKTLGVSDIVEDIAVLFSDNTMAFSNDVYTEFGNSKNFAAETKKAPYTASGVMTWSNGGKFVYQCTNVERNGEIAAVLFCFINVGALNEKYDIKLYDGRASQYLIEGVSGDFLLDTMHGQFWNMYDENVRLDTAKSGFSFDKLSDDITNGREGYSVFFSQDADDYLYMYYVPTGVCDWMAMISIKESIVMESAQRINNGMYLLMIFIFVVVIVFVIIKAYLTKINTAIRDKEVKELKASHETIRRMASTDALTGLKNRTSYKSAIKKFDAKSGISIACVYIDADSLHEINNNYGHSAGDEMLKFIAKSLTECFVSDLVFRIGGDEFVVLCTNQHIDTVNLKIADFRRIIDKSDFEISLGCEYTDSLKSVDRIVSEAEAKMYIEKKSHYENTADTSKMRFLDRRIDNILMEKHDRDSFLSAISSYFLGVYIIDLNSDATRSIFSPKNMSTLLEKYANKFKSSFEEYILTHVVTQERERLMELLDYKCIMKALEENGSIHITYTKLDGVSVRLYICKAVDYKHEKPDTVWLFEQNPGEGYTR